MGLTTAAFAAPAISPRRSDRLKKHPSLTPKMASLQKDDVQDTYVFEDRRSIDVMTTNAHNRWTYLENGINSVMLKLEEGVDMKTVWSNFFLESRHDANFSSLAVHGSIHV